MPKARPKKRNNTKMPSVETGKTDAGILSPEAENTKASINKKDMTLDSGKEQHQNREITNAIREIVAHFESLPIAKDYRIVEIIERQNELHQHKTESVELLKQSLEIADKQFRLAKKALRKAKDHKLNKEKIRLVKFEMDQAKTERKHLKHLLKQEKKHLKNIEKIISLLESAI
jgi:outer membrane PBP1 activator LpoA protein